MPGIMRTLWDESSDLRSEALSTHNMLVNDTLSAELVNMKEKSEMQANDDTIIHESPETEKKE